MQATVRSYVDVADVFAFALNMSCSRNAAPDGLVDQGSTTGTAQAWPHGPLPDEMRHRRYGTSQPGVDSCVTRS